MKLAIKIFIHRSMISWRVPSDNKKTNNKQMKKHSIFLILILLSLAFNGCKYDFILPEVVPVASNVSFSKQIVPIFTSKCIACHNNQTPQMTADVAYSQLVPNFVNLTSPESSKIYVVPSSGTHFATINGTQAGLILSWIKEGAKNN